MTYQTAKKLISLTQVRGCNTQFLLQYPQPRDMADYSSNFAVDIEMPVFNAPVQGEFP